MEFFKRIKDWVNPPLEVPEETARYCAALRTRARKVEELRVKLAISPIALDKRIHEVSAILGERS